MAGTDFEGCVKACKESAQTLTETIPNLRRVLKVKKPELSSIGHELAIDAHWDGIISLVNQISQSLNVIQSSYEAQAVNNETKDAEIHDLESQINNLESGLLSLTETHRKDTLILKEALDKASEARRLDLEAQQALDKQHSSQIRELTDEVQTSKDESIKTLAELDALSQVTSIVRETLSIEPSEDIDTKVKALLQAMSVQETTVRELRDSTLQSQEHLKQSTTSHEKEMLQAKKEHSDLIEQMVQEHSATTEKLQTDHQIQNELLRNEIAKLSLDLEAAEENRQHMIADHAKELSDVMRNIQQMEEAYSAQTLLMTQTKKTAATGPTSPATMSSDNLEGWENFGFGTASRRPDEPRPSLIGPDTQVGPDTHQDHMGEQHDDTNFMADNDDETYNPDSTPDEDTPSSDKRVRSSVTPSPTKRARVRFDDSPLQEILTPFQHQQEADTTSNQQLLPSTQRTTRSGRSVLSSTTPSRSWQNAPVEQSRARALTIINMFFFDWRVTAEETRSIQVIFNSLFSRGAAVNVYVEAIDKHALGRFDMPPSLPHPCLIAQLKNKPAGNPMTGRLTMTRKSCNWCKQTDAICLWAVHVPGVDTGFGPRDVNGRITGDNTVWREPATRTLTLETGEQVRWILKRRKETQTDPEDPRTMSGPLFGDY